jgi:hypothetical protein
VYWIRSCHGCTTLTSSAVTTPTVLLDQHCFLQPKSCMPPSKLDSM